jgi:PAS domain S-box-containing protein
VEENLNDSLSGKSSDIYNILHIDENPLLLSAGKTLLEESSAGFKLSTACSQKEAEKLLAGNVYDVIISDYRTDGIDGIKLLRSLRSRGDRTPFIIFTESRSADDAIEALNGGADYYLRKEMSPISQFSELYGRALSLAEENKASGRAVDYKNNLLSGIINGIPDVLAIQYADHTIECYNEAGYRLLGMTPDEVRNKKCYNLIGRDTECSECATREAVKTKKMQRIEKYVPEVGLYLDCLSVPVLDEDGNIVRIIEQLRDITEKKRTEDALRESEEKYVRLYKMMRMMCDNIPDMVWAKDTEKRYIFANRATCVNLLCAEDTAEPVGKTDLFFAERERARHPEDPKWHTFGEICSDSDQITMDVKVPQHFDEYGNIKGKFVFLDVHKAPFLNEKGEMIGTVGSGRDITARKKAEEKLLKSEERLKLTLDATNDGIWDWDIPTGNAFFSPRWYTMLGYEPDEMPAAYDTWRELIHPDDIGPAEEYINENIVSGKEGYQLEFRMRTKSGDYRWIYARGNVVQRDGDGNPVRMVGTHTDITERKNAEIALRESEDKFRTLVERASQMLFLHDLDGNIIDVNRKGIKTTGYSRDELLALNVADIDPDADKRADERWLWHDMPEYGDSVFEVWHRRKDGSVYPAEVHATKISIGGQYYILALVTDITERKRNEEALFESEKKYRDIFENSVTGLFRTTPEGIIVDANDSLARMYGYGSRAELLKENVNAADMYANPAERERVLSELSENGIVENYEVTHVKRDKSLFKAIITARKVRDGDGNLLYCEGSVTDITKLRQTEDALYLANRKLQILSAITRHDILNNITVIRGFLDIIGDFDDYPLIKEYLESLNVSAVAIQDQIEFTREYEKLGVDRPAWLTLSDIIRKTGRGKLPVSYECGEYLIYADPMLEKVF